MLPLKVHSQQVFSEKDILNWSKDIYNFTKDDHFK